MSSFTKAQGSKIAIKFTENITSDYTDVMEDVYFEQDTYSRKLRYASAEHTSFPLINAFDGNDSNYFSPGYRSVNQWVRIDPMDGMASTLKTLVLRSGAGGYYTSWTLQGSNDGAIWDTVQAGSHTATNETLTFTGLDASYIYWQLLTGGTRSGNYPGWSRIQLFGDETYFVNAGAFTLYAQEPRWTEIPSLTLGPLIDSDIEVQKVEAHPTEPNAILLTCFPIQRFANIEGNITINYNSVLGNLAGLGGIVESFEQTFTPADLERMIKPHLFENLKCVPTVDIIFARIYHQVAGDGDWPADDYRSIKYVREYDAGPPEVLEQQKGALEAEKLLCKPTISLTLIHVDAIDP